MRLIHCLSWTKCWWAFWWTNCSHFLASSSNPGSPLSPSAYWHKTLSGQAWTRAGYRTEYYLVQKLPSTKYCIVVAALKYGILGSTKYSLTIVWNHCDCLITIFTWPHFERMFIPHYVSCVTCHLSCVTCHLSHVTCHVSPVKCQTKNLTFFSFLKKK